MTVAGAALDSRFKNFPRAVQAAAARRGDVRFILQQIEIAHACFDAATDVAVRNSVAEADDHVAGPRLKCVPAV